MSTGISPVSLAIMTLVACEEGVAELYALFARQQPALAAVWWRLVEEEKTHAQRLRDILPAVKRGDVRFTGADPVSQEAFDAFLHYVRERLAEVQARPCGELAALAIARDIESTVIETSYDHLFESGSAAIRQALHAIAEETNQHHAEIDRLWQHARLRATRPRPPAAER